VPVSVEEADKVLREDAVLSNAYKRTMIFEFADPSMLIQHCKDSTLFYRHLVCIIKTLED